MYEFFWVYVDNMELYSYDKLLCDKLILFLIYCDLLDVLIMDFGVFVNDFVEGKSVGNVIFCKGIFGVGKILIVEVYVELIECLLYLIYLGVLGIIVEVIEENLKVIFQCGSCWNCVFFFDEVDVFVVQWGNNIEQNVIVVEFLCMLEYFDGLLFMMMNCFDDIDEVIILWCVVIIDYVLLIVVDVVVIWWVMVMQFQVELGDELIVELVVFFFEIVLCDIKMLFCLVFCVVIVKKELLMVQMFCCCVMFCVIKM